MKTFFTHPASPRPLRFTLLALHASGVIQVYRRHSILRVWEPLREHPSRHEALSE
jgi:hypothetical protein